MATLFKPINFHGKTIVATIDFDERFVGKKYFTYTKKNKNSLPYLIYKKKLFHRQTIDVPEGMFVDHINRDRLDNRISNLRIVTMQENNSNSSKRRNFKTGTVSSRFRGVEYNKSNRNWRVRFYHKGKKIIDASFDSEIVAAERYNEMCDVYRNGNGKNKIS